MGTVPILPCREPLPYLMQDAYTRQRQEGRLPIMQVENDALRAMFYPSLGGRQTAAASYGRW